ncbi:unnamed protein product [Moneuplotes crassus]|uniref:Uncharacterized protein n=1 Tax=Euplotes crassus TaxID=5936 RepID=A0AAD1YAR9_EUPCR|nr:unnamed protein product [Moneuplotes crassus]
MSKLNVVACLSLLICAVMAKERLEFVFQYNSAAERTPLYRDQVYNITKNNYGQEPNMITLTGLRNAFNQGEKFRDYYTNDHPYFLSPRYVPSEYFIRTFTDNPGIMSAYAFMLGGHPSQLDGLGLVREKDDSAPLKDNHIDDARRALYLDRAEAKAMPAYIHTGNADGFFFRDIKKMYPGLQDDFNYNLKQAASEFETKYGERLYKRLSFLMGRNIEEISFDSVAQFLDDYICAFANGKATTPFDFNEDMMDLIETYYYYLIHHGLLRDPSLNKVISHPFLYSLLREILFKAQDLTEISRWEGPCVTSKVSLAFGNRLTYLAALRTLNLDDEITYNPGWGDQLTFELYQEAGEWFVKIYKNNELVRSISKDGRIPLEEFKHYVCSRLYYGNLDAVEAGFEDYHKKAQIRGSQCRSLTKVVPLFGCSLKKEYNHDQTGRGDIGWIQNELRANDIFRQYGGRAPTDDSVYFIKAKQNSGYSYTYNYGDNSYSTKYANTGNNLIVNNGNGEYDTGYYGGRNISSGYSSSSGNQLEYRGNIYADSYGPAKSRSFESYTNNRNPQKYDYYNKNQGNYLSPRIDMYNSNNNEQNMPVTVEHQSSTYIIEEECDLISPTPSCKKEYNLFKVTPIMVKQRQNAVPQAMNTKSAIPINTPTYNTEYTYSIEQVSRSQPVMYTQHN